VPTMPSCLLEPIWSEFAALLPDRPPFHPDHPLGCHRRRIPDRIIFDHIVAALVHGSGYDRLTGQGCSDRTIRRRLKQWAGAGLAEHLHALTRRAYDLVIGLQLGDVAVDGCSTKAPGGGQVAGRSPVDRGKQGRKRSVATDGAGIPVGHPTHHQTPQVNLLLGALSGIPGGCTARPAARQRQRRRPS
jgi:hypothetical protein